MHAIPKTITSNDWITLIFLGILLILVFLKTRYPEESFNFRRLLFSNKYFIENRKSLKVLGGFGFSLFFVQAITFSFGIYLVFGQAIISDKPSFLVFVDFFLIYTVFIASKYFIEKILGTLFSIENILDRYIFFKITIKNFLAICLLPLLIFLTYFWHPARLLLKVGMGAFLMLNAMALVVFYRKRQQQISSNFFYFILYLCTFEIAPYYILYKVMA